MTGVLSGNWEFVYSAFGLTGLSLLLYLGWALKTWRAAELNKDG